MFSNTVCVLRRHIADCDATLSSRLLVDVVRAGASADYELEMRCRFNALSCDFLVGGRDNSSSFEPFEQLVWCRACVLDDLVLKVNRRRLVSVVKGDYYVFRHGQPRV